jgi:hypothetical protein
VQSSQIVMLQSFCHDLFSRSFRNASDSESNAFLQTMRRRSPELVTLATQHVRTREETVNAHASAKYPMMIRARIRGVRAPQQGSPAAADGATFQRTSLRESQSTGPTVSRNARRDFVPDHAAQEMPVGGVGKTRESAVGSAERNVFNGLLPSSCFRRFDRFRQ